MKDSEIITFEKRHNEKVSELSKQAVLVNQGRVKIFCPLIKSNCRIDCECYVRMYVKNMTFVKSEIDDYTGPYTTGGYCTCYQLKGNG